MSNMESKNLFTQSPLIYFYPQIEHCPVCSHKLQVKKSEIKTVYTFEIGEFKANQFIYYCPHCNCGVTYVSEELKTVVPKYCNFGYDIIVYVGKAVYQRYRTSSEIVTELAELNVKISASTVNLLATRFIVYLAIAHKNITNQLLASMQIKGGYILHFDGTNEGASPHLISALDELSQIVLSNVKIPTESAAQIVPFLKSIQQQYGDPVAVISDMGRAMLGATSEVFTNTPTFICHFHFLRDIGKDLLEKYYGVIRNTLKKYGISTQLRSRLRQYSKDNVVGLETNLEKIIQPPANQIIECDQVHSLCYTLIVWALDGKSCGNGFGFPFDRPHLVFYNRIKLISTILTNYLQNDKLSISVKGKKVIETLLADLIPLVTDKWCENNVSMLEQKIVAFERLRVAMRIALPDSKQGINDHGIENEMKTIELEISQFRTWLINKTEYKTDDDYKKMVAQIDKYWKMLFSDPIQVNTPNGTVTIQPQRTNNIMEQFFRRLKRAHRRTTGNNSYAKKLQTMFADTPLVKNLENIEYMKLLLGNKTSLEEIFSQIDSQTVINQMKVNKKNEEKIPIKIKLFIKKQNVQEIFLNLSKAS